MIGIIWVNYSHILCYVDSILCIHHDAMVVLARLDKYFKLKPALTGDPDIYFGTKLRRMRINDGVVAWGMSPSKYVKESIMNCAIYVSENFKGRYSLPKTTENHFKMGHEPAIDISPALDPSAILYYQSLIDTMHIYVATKVSLLLSHLAYHQEGYLEAALHMVAYLRQKHNSQLDLTHLTQRLI